MSCVVRRSVLLGLKSFPKTFPLLRRRTPPHLFPLPVRCVTHRPVKTRTPTPTVFLTLPSTFRPCTVSSGVLYVRSRRRRGLVHRPKFQRKGFTLTSPVGLRWRGTRNRLSPCLRVTVQVHSVSCDLGVCVRPPNPVVGACSVDRTVAYPSSWISEPTRGRTLQ